MLAIDANTTSSLIGTGTAHSFTHVCGTIPNRGLFVIACLRGTINTPNTVQATYAGVSMTSLGEVSSAAGKVTVAAFSLVAPASGSNSVVVGWIETAVCAVVARSYYGVNQGIPVLASSFASQQFIGLTPSLTVTSYPGDIVMDAIGYTVTTASTASVGPGQTAVMDIELSTTTLHASASVENGAAPNVAMSWTLSSGSNGAQLGFSIHAASGGRGAAISPSLFF